jgi:hypothetical protein
MSFQVPARFRRAKTSPESFAGLIVGSFIIAALSEEWRVAALNASEPDKSGTGHFGGEDAFTFVHDDAHAGSAIDPVGSLIQDRSSVPTLDGVAEAAFASGFDGLSLDGIGVAGFERDDAAGVVAHHQAGWLVTHA